ncbi:DNA-binding protein [Exidia glandulosa HHB12029]|uniref:DNA-binding protein n=1 Tax=Exidia glandulosa HHB12029 TaxID=1314781 RepID=A0A165M7M2_EXIGL|nr:DNA-binding protein [Exidia glandulosa HHB12029]
MPEEPADDDGEMTYPALSRAIADFLETAIHTLLCIRGVYPDNLFVKRRRFDAVVSYARHPALREYIKHACNAIYEELLLGSINRVAVVITDGEATLERFVFDVRNMVAPSDDEGTIQGAPQRKALAQLFRGFMLKIGSVTGMLRPLNLSDDASFSIVIELKDNIVPTAAEPSEPPPWVPAARAHTTAGAADDPSARLHYVSAIETGVINVSLAVQETGVLQQQSQEAYT